MNSQIKNQWIQALRSGAYTQTTKTLKDQNGFCCLGVLCDLHRLSTGRGHWDTNGDYIADGERSDGRLPLPVVRWAELSGANPLLMNSTSVWISAAALNDNGTTFNEIATLIESEANG